jgi:hypothetical protein
MHVKALQTPLPTRAGTSCRSSFGALNLLSLSAAIGPPSSVPAERRDGYVTTMRSIVFKFGRVRRDRVKVP